MAASRDGSWREKPGSTDDWLIWLRFLAETVELLMGGSIPLLFLWWCPHALNDSKSVYSKSRKCAPLSSWNYLPTPASHNQSHAGPPPQELRPPFPHLSGAGLRLITAELEGPPGRPALAGQREDSNSIVLWYVLSDPATLATSMSLFSIGDFGKTKRICERRLHVY